MIERIDTQQNFLFPASLVLRLSDYCRQGRCSRSQVVRQALSLFFELSEIPIGGVYREKSDSTLIRVLDVGRTYVVVQDTNNRRGVVSRSEFDDEFQFTGEISTKASS